jgi:hypothetical protein
MRDALASALIERFDRPDVKSIVLMGSHARGDAGPYSDVDLVRVISEAGDLKPQAHSYLWDGCLVIVSDRGPSEIENWFSAPEEASNVIGGLRSASHLLDRDQTFARIQARAVGWDSEWVRLRRIAFGIAGENEVAPSLREQVTASLRMYVVTAEMLVGVLRPEDEPLVAETVRLIKRTLSA